MPGVERAGSTLSKRNARLLVQLAPLLAPKQFARVVLVLTEAPMETDALPTIGDWLRAQLARRRMSQRAFAREIGVSSAQMSEWIMGRRTPSSKSCIKLADALDADLDAVLMMAGHRAPGYAEEEDPAIANLIALLRRAISSDPDERETRIEMVGQMLESFLTRDRARRGRSAGGAPRNGPRPD